MPGNSCLALLDLRVCETVCMLRQKNQCSRLEKDTMQHSQTNLVTWDCKTGHVAKCNVAMQVELAQYAHLCTIMSNMHHRRAGYPFGTIVDFASDGAGCPLFCLSPLAIHTRNIMEDPRCSLVVQMPGWTGMANARVTIFGDVYQLPPEMHEAAREVLPRPPSLSSPVLPSTQSEL